MNSINLQHIWHLMIISRRFRLETCSGIFKPSICHQLQNLMALVWICAPCTIDYIMGHPSRLQSFILRKSSQMPCKRDKSNTKFREIACSYFLVDWEVLCNSQLPSNSIYLDHPEQSFYTFNSLNLKYHSSTCPFELVSNRKSQSHLSLFLDSQKMKENQSFMCLNN